MRIPAEARSLVWALCALTVACGDSPPPTEVEPPPVEPPVIPPVDPPPGLPPLPSGIHVLAGISHTLPYTDLAPFRDIVGDTRVVALGESTHMSHGYYQMKHRLIRYMVEQLGFRVVGIESPWLEARVAEQYVATCEGTPNAALASLNAVWRDVSVRDMLVWMCDWNRTNPADPVTFFGFDVQEPGRSVRAVTEFVAAAAPGEASRTAPLRECLGGTYETVNDFYRSQEYRDFVAGHRNMSAHDACIAAIDDLETWIPANAAALASATSGVAVEEALIALVALRGYEDQLWVPDPGGYQARDSGMAEVARRAHALHTPGQKMVLWAWNWHIAYNYQEVRGFNENPQQHVGRQGARAMGGFLRDAYGPDYLAIALIGYQVEMIPGYTPIPLQTNALAVERRLYDLERDYLLVDLRQPLPDTIIEPGRVYRVSQEWGDPYRQFGALLYLKRSPPMQSP